MEKPKLHWRYVTEGGELALYWLNPWEKREEKIATFWWPVHPIEATEQVERWFEEIASKAASSDVHNTHNTREKAHSQNGCKGCPDCKGVIWKGPGD